MGSQFELVKYDMGRYLVFYIEPEASLKSASSNHIGFVVIELKDIDVECSLCHKEARTIQTWWHKKLPFSYIISREKNFNVHLCLNCANAENNHNILLLKNNYTDEYDAQNKQKLLHQYEIENEQIEYYKIYKNQEGKKKIPA